MPTTTAPQPEDTRESADERPSPDTPADALELLDFKAEDLKAHLDAAHEELWSHVDDDKTEADSRRLEVTFCSFNPVNANNGVDRYNQMPSGDWMQYNCALTGMHVAVREGAPVPVVALYETTESGSESLMECWKIHPDFLKDRGRLFKMLVSKLQEDVFAGVFQARLAHSLLRYLSGRDDVPGRPTEGVTYPGGEGYEALGRRPVHDE